MVRNLCAGRVALGGEAHVEPSQLEMQSCYDWDVWYDYCCLPEAGIFLESLALNEATGAEDRPCFRLNSATTPE